MLAMTLRNGSGSIRGRVRTNAWASSGSCAVDASTSPASRNSRNMPTMYAGSGHCHAVRSDAGIDPTAPAYRCDGSICLRSRPDAFGLLAGETKRTQHLFNTRRNERTFFKPLSVASFAPSASAPHRRQVHLRRQPGLPGERRTEGMGGGRHRVPRWQARRSPLTASHRLCIKPERLFRFGHNPIDPSERNRRIISRCALVMRPCPAIGRSCV